MNHLLSYALPALLLLATVASAQDAAAEQRPTGPLHGLGNWELITEEAAFSPRDTAEPILYDGKMWLSNGYYHGNVNIRDLWNTTDGVTWTEIIPREETPYPMYSEMVAYDGKMWAVKGQVWNSTDGVNWTQVLEKTPFGTRGYGETVVFQDKIWQLGSGADVWNTSDGVEWTRVLEEAPYGDRACCAVTVFDGKLWVMGGRIREPNDPPEAGYENTTTYNDVWCSEDGVNWTRVLEEAPWAPRMWFVAEAYAGYMWIFGGYDNRNAQNLGDVWYTKDGVTWWEFVSEPTFKARHEPTTYVYEGSLWMVAGNTWPVVNDVWRLTLPEQQQ